MRYSRDALAAAISVLMAVRAGAHAERYGDLHDANLLREQLAGTAVLRRRKVGRPAASSFPASRFEFVGLVCAGDLPDDGSVIIAKQFARLPEIDFDLHRFNASINSGP